MTRCFAVMAVVKRAQNRADALRTVASTREFRGFPLSEDIRCNICSRDIHMTSQDSSTNGPGLTKTEWELLLDAIHAYSHNADYRILHGKLATLARASGVRPKNTTLTSGNASRT